MGYKKEVLASKAEVRSLTELWASHPSSFCLMNSSSWSGLLPVGSLPLTRSTHNSSEDETDAGEGNAWGWSPLCSQNALLPLEDPRHGAFPKSSHQAINIPTSSLNGHSLPQYGYIFSQHKGQWHSLRRQVGCFSLTLLIWLKNSTSRGLASSDHV